METFKTYLDKIFAGKENIPEVKDMYDEVMGNCCQRYQEYIAQGMADGEATAKVISELGDLQVLVKEIENGKKRSVPTVFDHAPSTKPLQQIDIDVRGYDIRLEGTDGNDIDVYASNKIEQRIENGTLYLSEKRNGFAWYLASRKPLVVQIPAGFNKIKIKTISADVVCEHLSVQNIYVETISGDVSGAIQQTQDLQVTTVSGDIDLHTGTDDVVCFATASGDIICHIDNFQTMKINTTSGDMDIDICHPFQLLTMHTVSGDIKLSTSNVQGLHVCTHTISGDIDNVIREGNDGEVQAYTVSGDMDLK